MMNDDDADGERSLMRQSSVSKPGSVRGYNISVCAAVSTDLSSDRRLHIRVDIR